MKDIHSGLSTILVHLNDIFGHLILPTSPWRYKAAQPCVDGTFTEMQGAWNWPGLRIIILGEKGFSNGPVLHGVATGVLGVKGSSGCSMPSWLSGNIIATLGELTTLTDGD